MDTYGVLRVQVSGYHFLWWYPRDPNVVRIGCQTKTISQWLRLSDRYGKRAGYTDDEIKKVRKVIQAIKGIRDALK